MQMVARIWSDIRQGENIDLYLAVAVAIVTGIAALLGWGTPVQVAGLAVTVLALLAFSMLQSRYKLEQSINGLRTYLGTPDFLSSEMPDMKKRLQGAKSISISGTSLARTSTTMWAEFAENLQMGAHIRLLVVDPNHIAADVAVARFHKHQDPQRLRTEIHHALDNLEGLQEKAANGGKLEIRFAHFSPPFGIWLVDPDRSEAQISVELYAFRAPSEPSFTLSRSHDGKWFDFFQNQFELMWRAAETQISKP